MLKKSYTILMVVGMLAAGASSVQAAEKGLLLEESIMLAMQNNDQIKAVKSGDEAAKWELEKAKGAYALTANYAYTGAKIGGEYWQTFHINDDPSSYFINSVSASLPLYTGGRIEHTVEQAKLGVAISALEVRGTKQQIRYQVTQAYYMVLDCQNMQQVKTEAVSQLQEHLRNVQAQFAVGSVAKADVLRSEVALANAEQALVTAQNNAKVAMAAFNKIVGQPLQSTVVLAESMSYRPADYQLGQCIDYALQHRPARLTAAKAVAQAEQGIAIAQAGKKPTVSFDASYTTYDTRVGEFDTRQWLVGVTASINLLDGNVTAAQVKAAKARSEQVKHQAKDITSTVEFEVQQAYLNMKKAESNIGTNQVAVEKATEDFKLASARYGVNLGTNLDVVDAQVALTTARTAYTESLYDYNVSKAALENAMGLE